MPQTAKVSKPTSPNVAFSNLPRCLKQQKLNTYIPKYCLSKSSKMPQAAKAQNLHPKMMPVQIFQHASNSKSSKPTSQNIAFPNLPRCLKQEKLKTYIPKCCLSKSSKMPQTAKAQTLHPKILPFQIFHDASNSKSSKTYIRKCCLSKSPEMPQTAKSFKMPRTAKAQNPHPKTMPFQIFLDAKNSKSSKSSSQNVAVPNLPSCLKQQKLKTHIPKRCLSKSSNMPNKAKAQNLHPKLCLSKSSKMPRTAKAQNLHPKMLPLQIFPDASNGKSSKSISQIVAFPSLPTYLKEQKLKTYIPKCCLSKSSKMPQTAKAQNLHPKMLPFQIFQDVSNSKSAKPTSQNVAFPDLPTNLKQQKLKTYISNCCFSKFSKMPQTAQAQPLHPKMVPFQIFHDATNCKSSKPTSQNVAFPNLPRCLDPKMVPFQIFHDASNSNSSKPTSQNVAFSNLPRCLKQQKLKTYIPKCCLSKSSKMPQTAKAQNLHPKILPFPNLPSCQQQQKIKTYIRKCCLSKSSKMPQTARAQNLHPKMLPSQIFQQPQTAKAQHPHSKMLPFQILQDASNSKSSKPRVAQGPRKGPEAHKRLGRAEAHKRPRRGP